LAKRVRRRKVNTYSTTEREWIIRVYYGGDDYKSNDVSMRRVSKILNIPLVTVFGIIKAFKKAGFIIPVDRRIGKFKMIPPQI
jgi:hypothetical protein